MIKIKRMGVDGVVGFRQQVFEFKEGVSYVYGNNKTNKQCRGTSNGAGKSAFFGQLPEMLYDSPVVGVKQDRAKMGRRFVECEIGGRSLKIMSAFSTNGKEQITIWDADKQKKFVTPTKGKQAIAQVFKPTSEDFNTYVYIDSRVPHPLVRGSSIQRKTFFTRFFGLNRIDAERKLFTAELASLMRVKKAHEELTKSLADIKTGVLPRSEVLALREEYTELKARCEVMQRRADRAERVRSLCDFAGSSKDQIAKLSTYCGDEITEESFAEALKDAKWNIKNDEEGLAHARAWEDHKKESERYYEVVRKLGPGTKDASAYADDARRYEQLLPKYRVIQSKLEDLVEVERPAKVAKPEGDLTQLSAQHTNVKNSLEHSHKFGTGKCHTCGQSVEIKDPAKLRARLKSLASKIEQHEAYARYLEELREYQEYREASEALKTTEAKYKQELRGLKDAYSKHKVLSQVTKPKPFEGKKLDVKIKEKMLQQSREKLSLLEFCKPHLETILEFTALTERDLKLRTFDPSALNKLRDRMASIRASLEVHSNVKAKAKNLQDRIAAMEVELKNEAPLKLLIQGYSDKTMKKMAIEAICSRLMALVNHYAHSYFPGFTFEFLWGTQLSIVAHRPNGEASDVRKLSGAESLLFTLVLLMSLAAFVPTRKRTSILILDEPSSSFSKETTRLFHEMLPELNKIFPSIVVITPKTEEQYPGAHNYTVVKTEKRTTIEEGIHV